MTGYWPFWAGAPLLAALVLGFARLLGRPLGVSGSWTRLTSYRAEEQAREDELAIGDAAAMEAALLAATSEEFGAEAASAEEIAFPSSKPNSEPESKPESTAGESAYELPAPLPVRASPLLHLSFLAAITAGACAASLSTGSLRVMSIGAAFERFAGTGPHSWAVLFAGGILVGFGARMAGGCTTGHGLSGCSRLQPGSLLAIASFFATAVLVTMALPR